MTRKAPYQYLFEYQRGMESTFHVWITSMHFPRNIPREKYQSPAHSTVWFNQYIICVLCTVFCVLIAPALELILVLVLLGYSFHGSDNCLCTLCILQSIPMRFVPPRRRRTRCCLWIYSWYYVVIATKAASVCLHLSFSCFIKHERLFIVNDEEAINELWQGSYQLVITYQYARGYQNAKLRESRSQMVCRLGKGVTCSQVLIEH